MIELPQMAMRVPDPRVAISPSISTPSQAHFPTGKLQFVIFRRDLANSAPDRVSLRVVARVARVLTFDTHGKPTTSKVDELRGSFAAILIRCALRQFRKIRR